MGVTSNDIPQIKEGKKEGKQEATLVSKEGDKWEVTFVDGGSTQSVTKDKLTGVSVADEFHGTAHKLTDNKFPYMFNEKVKHMVFWYPVRELDKKDVPNYKSGSVPKWFKDRAIKALDEVLQSDYNLSVLDKSGKPIQSDKVIFWENSYKSIPACWHMQVLIRGM